jgi:hypothetical protein
VKNAKKRILENVEDETESKDFNNECKCDEEISQDKLKNSKENIERAKKRKQEKENLEKVAETVERAGISANMASQLINDVKAAAGAITDNDQENVKLSRLLNKVRKNKMVNKKGRLVETLMFDVRKDFVKKQTEDSFEITVQENCSVVIFPGPGMKLERQKMDILKNKENNEFDTFEEELEDEIELCDKRDSVARGGQDEKQKKRVEEKKQV